MNSSNTARIVGLLREQGFHLLEQQGEYRAGSFTFDNPHSCQHCQQEHIQVHKELSSYRCWQCSSEGTGTVLENSDQRSCTNCGRITELEWSLKYSATLSYGLENAVVAVSDGCALYAHLLQSLGPVQSLAQGLAKLYDREVPDAEIRGLRFHLTGVATLSKPNRRCILSATFGEYSFQQFETDGWTTWDDGASKYVDARPYELDTDSDASWDFARRCLKTCRESHLRCRGRLTDAINDQWWKSKETELGPELTNIGNVPTRLLQIHHASSQAAVRLLDIEAMNDEEANILRSSGFAILSYCWGRDQALTLTKQSDRYLRDGFLVADQLPKTIKDAIHTARKLGLSYLWVDALCIYQDSGADKSLEIPRMETYYTCATITICAAAASDCLQGFLHRRHEPSYGFGPVRLTLRNAVNNDEEGSIYLLVEESPPDEPTTTRGRTLQESLLSRRLLIYGSRQVFWSCADASAGCGGSSRTLVPRTSGNALSFVPFVFPIADLLFRPVASMWQYLWTVYTARTIGESADKLPAISALVAHMMTLAQDRGEKCTYIAGFPLNLDDEGGDIMAWSSQLLWYSLELAKAHRPGEYRAPSWSWAAIDDPVFPGVDSGIANFIGKGCAASSRIRNYAFDLVHQNSPYGGVKSAYLVMEAKLRLLSECDSFPSLPLCTRLVHRKVHEIDDDYSPRLELLPDTSEDHEIVQRALESSTNDDPPGIQISLLFLMLHPSNRTSLGLIVSGANPKSLKRIGIFYTRQKDDGSGLFDASTVFQTSSIQTVCLV